MQAGRGCGNLSGVREPCLLRVFPALLIGVQPTSDADTGTNPGPLTLIDNMGEVSCPTTSRGHAVTTLYHGSMNTEYEVPRDLPQDPEEITPEMAAEWMREVRNQRQTRNLTFPRFVKALNRAGYPIGVEDYKIIERAPKLSLPHVQEGLLVYVAKVFNALRVSGSVQDAATEYAMIAIGTRRREKGMSFLDMSIALAEFGIPFSEASYRTAEQGIMKEVPWGVIAGSVKILDLEPSAIFRD